MMLMFAEYAEAFGPEAVEKGVDLAIQRRLKAAEREERKFFPSPDEFESAIRDSKYRPQVGKAKKSCKVCKGDGWKLISGRAAPCECRKL